MVGDKSVKILETVEELIAGNNRYVNEQMKNYEGIGAQRDACVNGQTPHTTVIACSDSRVISEMIFDQGPSRIFSIETAGNILDNISMGSVEYGVLHAHTPVLMVLAHTRCGAVTATFESRGKIEEGHLKFIAEKIAPAFENGFDGDRNETIYRAILRNGENVVNEILSKSNEIKDEYNAGNVAIVLAIYKLETGKVELIDVKHPNTEIVEKIKGMWQ